MRVEARSEGSEDPSPLSKLRENGVFLELIRSAACTFVEAKWERGFSLELIRSAAGLRVLGGVLSSTLTAAVCPVARTDLAVIPVSTGAVAMGDKEAIVAKG